MLPPTNQVIVKDLAQNSGVGADISFDTIEAKVSFDLPNTLEGNKCKKTHHKTVLDIALLCFSDKPVIHMHLFKPPSPCY